MHPCAMRLQNRNVYFEAENDTAEEIKTLALVGHKRAREKLFDDLQTHALT